MAFVCPACGEGTLEIVASVELGPGDHDDERSIQRVRCTCGQTGAAEYRESRRGGGESWHHDGYLLDDDGAAALAAWFDDIDPARGRKGHRPIDGIRDLTTPTSQFAMRFAER